MNEDDLKILIRHAESRIREIEAQIRVEGTNPQLENELVIRRADIHARKRRLIRLGVRRTLQRGNVSLPTVM